MFIRRPPPISCLLLMLVLQQSIGCDATSSVRVDPASRTQGWSVQLQRISGDGSSVWYDLRPDGTLWFAGGLAALQRRPSWSGPMTDEEIAELVALLERLDWFEEAPESSDEPPELQRRITLTGPPGRRRITLRGDDTDAGELETLLEQVSRRRNDPFLEDLPRASQSTTSQQAPPP